MRYSSLFLELGAGNEPGRHAGRARFVPPGLGHARVRWDPGPREGGGDARRLYGLDLLRDVAEGVGL